MSLCPYMGVPTSLYNRKTKKYSNTTSVPLHVPGTPKQDRSLREFVRTRASPTATPLPPVSWQDTLCAIELGMLFGSCVWNTIKQPVTKEWLCEVVEK